jgi:DNA-binding CsgD family transcriptional regulator
MRKHDDEQVIPSAQIDAHLKVIHRNFTPPFDLISCEILDSILQHATTEQISLFSHVHVDTVRRTLHTIEAILETSSHSQIIDNCHIRQWSSTIQHTITLKNHHYD